MKKKFLFWWGILPFVLVFFSNEYTRTGLFRVLVVMAFWATVCIMLGFWRLKQYRQRKAEQREERELRVEALKATTRAANIYADKNDEV